MSDKNKNTEPLNEDEKALLEELLQRQARHSYQGFRQMVTQTHWLTRVVVVYAIVGLCLILLLAAGMPTRSPTVVRNYALSNTISIGFNVLFVFWWYWVKQR